MLTIGGFNPHECGLLTKKNGSRNMEISYIVSLGNCDFFFKLTIIGSDNGLSPARRQAIIWTNDGILLIGPLRTNVSEILIEIYTFLFKKMRLKLSSAKWWPFCLGLSVLFNHARGYPASREMLDRRWANVITYVGAMSANDVGPTWICPSVQRWHNVITPPTMTLCQRFANAITCCILLYLMVCTTFAHYLYEWVAKHWHIHPHKINAIPAQYYINFIIAHCLSTITIKITSFIWKAVA